MATYPPEWGRRTKSSGGRLLSCRTQPSANRAAAIFRLAAMNLDRTPTALGAFCRRPALSRGQGESHHPHRSEARDSCLTHPERRPRVSRSWSPRVRRPASHAGPACLRPRAANLGLGLVDHTTGEVAEGTVSQELGFHLGFQAGTHCGGLVVFIRNSGEPGGNRTHNPQIKSLLLCQLSYRPAGKTESLT